MKYALTILMIVWIFILGCDAENVVNSFASANSPEAKISILNQDELNDVIPGDSISLQILFEVKNMVPIKEVIFKIGFNGELFKPTNLDESGLFVNKNSFNFIVEPFTDSNGNEEWDVGEEFIDSNGNGSYDEPRTNFFSLSGEPFTDNNQNSQWDEGENYNDENGNGEYDNADLSPIGLISVSSNSFEGTLGIPDPINNGNQSGSGDICILDLVGIYSESLITLEIIDVSEYDFSTSEFVEVSPHWDSWDVTSTLEVGSQYDPIISFNILEQESDYVTIELNIEDSPQIAEFLSIINYDTAVLNVAQYEFLNFFSSANYYNSYQNNIVDGRVSISSDHSIISNPNADLNSDPISQGTGTIIKIKFYIIDESASSTFIAIDGVSAKGYSISDEIVYDYNTMFWDIEETISIDF